MPDDAGTLLKHHVVTMYGEAEENLHVLNISN
jgi:hypothetical protein